MGVVGLGRIGEHAPRSSPTRLAWKCWPTTRASGRWLPGCKVEWCELDDLFARSDVISLHCPLTPQTAGLVNRGRL